MKRHLAILAAGALALAGCQVDDGPEPEPTQPAPFELAPIDPVDEQPEPDHIDGPDLDDEAIAIFVFRSFTNDLDTATSDNLTDAEVIEFAENTCALIALADTVEEFAVMAVIANEGTGMSTTDAGVVIGAAVGAFCPDEGKRIGMT